MRSLTLSAHTLAALSLLSAVACGLDSRTLTTSPAGAEPGSASSPAVTGAGGNAGLAPGIAPGSVPGIAPSSVPDGAASSTASVNDGAQQLDLLFVIDNSISMADKQALLGQVANVLDRFVDPLCVNATGTQAPALPGGNCPEGMRRQFEPVTDLHLGVISTSLGDAGANVACPTMGNTRYVPDRIDGAHLLGTLPRGNVPGINESGFISWHAGDDALAAATSFAGLVRAVGEEGCGFEMPLEAWYRFLIEPRPYAELVHVDCEDRNLDRNDCVQAASNTDGTVRLDEPLLAERKAFLRPSSRLGIVMLSDENDCSLVVGGQSWVAFAIDDARPYYRGSSACDQNPNDPCCYSCQFAAPDGCSEDPACDIREIDAGTLARRLAIDADGQNLRCFHQKQRFGVDLLYRVARYVNALTQPSLCATAPDLALGACAAPEPNPLFAGGRAASDVFLAAIVGVPYQLIEAQSDSPGRPPIASGFRYKIASELSAADWDAMVGDSSASPPVPPTSPFMVESELERPDIPPGNVINGHEWSTAAQVNGVPRTPDDLEYACILPLPTPRDCALADPATTACDCYPGSTNRPLCEETPGLSAAGTVQYWGKAYPGTRQLEVLHELGSQAVVGSICARNTTSPQSTDFAYRPSIAALVDSMAPSLQRP